MLNETMRAVVLLAIPEKDRSDREREELEFLRIVLERASRATAGRKRLELEADAHGLPSPQD